MRKKVAAPSQLFLVVHLLREFFSLHFNPGFEFGHVLSLAVWGLWSGLPVAALAALVVGPSQRRIIASTIAIVFLPLAAAALQLSQTPVDEADAGNAAESAWSTAKVRVPSPFKLAAAGASVTSAVSSQVTRRERKKTRCVVAGIEFSPFLTMVT